MRACVCVCVHVYMRACAKYFDRYVSIQLSMSRCIGVWVTQSHTSLYEAVYVHMAAE